MKMTKLKQSDKLTVGDFIKAFSSQKAVPISECAGFTVKDLDLFMDSDFEGFYRGTGENIQNPN
jgi:hypothetical protein